MESAPTLSKTVSFMGVPYHMAIAYAEFEIDAVHCAGGGYPKGPI